MKAETPPPVVDGRNTDLDWLRIGAFGLLILYHVGMFYVPNDWDWHVKSRWSSEPLTWLMYLTNPWRLGLLFLVSGAATRFMIAKLRPGPLAATRTARLLPPLLFGMAVIVAPQSYYQLVEYGGYTGSYLDFYPRYLTPLEFSVDGRPVLVNGEPLLTPTWNHLWFVVYLWVFTLALAGLLALFRRFPERLDAFAARALSGWGVLIWPWLVLALARVFLFPIFGVTHSLIDDWYNNLVSFFLFLVGFSLAKNAPVWAALDRARVPAAVIAVVSYLAWASYAWIYRAPDAAPGEALMTVMRCVYAADQWSFMVAALAYGRRWLSGRDGPIRRYLTDAIFPFYIIHQTTIVVAGYHLTRLGWPAPVESSVLIALTALSCFATYELVRRVGVLRPLFGLKSNATTGEEPEAAPRNAVAESAPSRP